MRDLEHVFRLVRPARPFTQSVASAHSTFLTEQFIPNADLCRSTGKCSEFEQRIENMAWRDSHSRKIHLFRQGDV